MARSTRAVPAGLAAAAVVALAILTGMAGLGWARGGPEPTAVATPLSATSSVTPTAPALRTAATTAPASVPSATPVGGPGLIVGVVGDSIMVSAVPGLQAEAASRGWTLVSGAHRACPVGYEPLFFPNGSLPPGKCESVRSLHDQLVASGPDFVIWLDINSRLARKDPDGQLLAPGSQAWKDDLFLEWTKVLDRFRDVRARVVVILPPLRSQQAAGCRGVASAARCREVQSQDAAIRAATRDWFEWLGRREDVFLVEVDSLLCPDGYPCPARISGVQVRVTGYDQTHFTAAGAAWFAPRLFDRALAALNGTSGAVPAG